MKACHCIHFLKSFLYNKLIHVHNSITYDATFKYISILDNCSNIVVKLDGTFGIEISIEGFSPNPEVPVCGISPDPGITVCKSAGLI